MALAESLLRKINRLGLVPKIIALLPAVSLLLALASVGWLLVLPMDGQYRNTYISENALMPGQVTSYFRESEWNYVRGFRSEASKWDFAQASQHNPVLESWLTDFGLTVAHHHHGTTDSLPLDTPHSTMYALMRAPRGDNTEAMVLVVPYYTHDGLDNVGAFALSLALARYFARILVWSKNIILVFPKNAHLDLRQWVEAYHTTLDVAAGSIDAALVIEYPSHVDNFHHLDIFYEGMNGQLPNLDLINTATTIARHENIPVHVQNLSGATNTYLARLQVLVRGILRLAVAGTDRRSYGCESFSGWQIQAITLRASGEGGPDITQFGRIVDSTFRSVNNLLEKFHQSFFFYLLLGPTHFVSIGTYLPSAALVAASFFISAVYLFVQGVLMSDFPTHIGKVLAIFTAVESACLAFAVGLSNVWDLSSAGTKVVTTWIYLAFALSAVLSLKALRPTPLLSATESYLLLSFALYVILMLVVSLLIVHFALAFSIGLCALPLALVPKVQASVPINRSKIVLLLLLSCPITVIAALGYLSQGVVPTFIGLLALSREMQSWTWFVIALGWFPVWVSVALACGFGHFDVANKEKHE